MEEQKNNEVALREFEYWWNTTKFELGTKPSEIARLAWKAALSLSSSIEPRCTCFERADGIGPMNGVHDSQCLLRHTAQASSEIRERIWCMECGKSVSTPVPRDTIVRAWVQCPECIEKGKGLCNSQTQK